MYNFLFRKFQSSPTKIGWLTSTKIVKHSTTHCIELPFQYCSSYRFNQSDWPRFDQFTKSGSTNIAKHSTTHCIALHISMVPAAGSTASSGQDLAKLLNLDTQTLPNTAQHIASHSPFSVVSAIGLTILIGQGLAKLLYLDTNIAKHKTICCNWLLKLAPIHPNLNQVNWLRNGQVALYGDTNNVWLCCLCFVFCVLCDVFILWCVMFVCDVIDVQCLCCVWCDGCNVVWCVVLCCGVCVWCCNGCDVMCDVCVVIFVCDVMGVMCDVYVVMFVCDVMSVVWWRSLH